MASGNPTRLLVVSAILILAGWLLPFLMVLKLLTPSFTLSFLSYASLLAGMMTGLVGVLQLGRLRRREGGE
ncbi:MAG: hypothetical protein RDU89_01650 [bacterium]|nr:hypothetical protein [bacterium]